jgi:DNA-binding PadR family transcriptional regulator
MPESTFRGALTEAVYYILLSLYKPTHGYGIMKFIRNTTDDRVIIGSGTLYGALGTLMKNKWIKIDDNNNDDKKCYIITETGKSVINKEMARLKELITHGEGIIEDRTVQ